MCCVKEYKPKKLFVYTEKVASFPRSQAEEKDALTQAAKDLLNRRAHEFRPSEVITAIPTQWSIKSIQPALEKMTRKSLQLVSSFGL